MQELFPFETRDDVLHIDRSGQATQARLAAEAAARGRTAVIVARNRDDFAQLSALAQLFTPSLSSGPAGDGTPVWGRGVVQLPQGLLLRRDGSAWAQRMAALYALSFEAPRIVDNKRFPADWATSGIGAACGDDCTHCGRCAEVFRHVCVEPGA